MKKSELLNWLHEENQKWEALLEQIGTERMDQPGGNGDWSMKDLVAHLTGWNRWLVARLQAAQRADQNQPQPGLRFYKRMMQSTPGSMSPIASVPYAKCWMKRVKYFRSYWPR